MEIEGQCKALLGDIAGHSAATERLQALACPRFASAVVREERLIDDTGLKIAKGSAIQPQ